MGGGDRSHLVEVAANVRTIILEIMIDIEARMIVAGVMTDTILEARIVGDIKVKGRW